MSGASIIESIGWALVHSTWVLLIPASLLLLWFLCFPKASATWRYNVALLSMISLPVLLAVVTWWCWHPSSKTDTSARAEVALEIATPSVSPIPEGVLPDPAVDPMSKALPEASQADFTKTLQSSTATGRIGQPKKAELATSYADKAGNIATIIRPWLPVLVGIWIVGVVLFSVRTCMGIRITYRLAHNGLSEVDQRIMTVFRSVAAKLNAPPGVRLMQSTLAQVPSVVGHFAPLVLLPASAVTGLSVPELEAILAHELAHVRRRDFLVNVVQRCVETLLFYHPAVWWISNVVRVERENCCDDIAMSVCNEPASLARALMLVEQHSQASPQLAVAATGGRLVKRIRRIAGVDSARSADRSWVAGMITLSAVCAVIMLFAASSASVVVGDDAPDNVVADQTNHLRDDLPGVPKTVAWPDKPIPWLDVLPDKTKGKRFVVDKNRWIEIVAMGTTDKAPIFWSPEGEPINAPKGFDLASLVPDPQDGSLQADRQLIVRMVVPNSDNTPFLNASGSGSENREQFVAPIGDHYKQVILKIGLRGIQSNHATIEYGRPADEWEELPHDIPKLNDAMPVVVERKRNLQTEIHNVSIYPGPRSILQIRAEGAVDPELGFAERTESDLANTIRVAEESKPETKNVSGKVTLANGKPKSNTWVGIFAVLEWAGSFQPKEKLLGEATTDEAGNFSSEIEAAISGGGYLVWAVDSDGSSALSRTRSLSELDVSFSDESGEILVLDPDQNPVADAELTLECVRKRRGFHAYVPPEVAKRIPLQTSKDGKAHLRGWPAEAIQGIAVRSKPYGVQYLSSSRSGQWVSDDRLTLTMKNTTIIAGKIQGFDPDLHSGLRLMATTFTYGRDVPVFGRAEVAVDDRGIFSIASLAAGRLQWESSLSPTSVSKLRLPSTQQIAAGQLLRQRFPIVPATRVRQRLIKQDTGEPAADVPVRVFWGGSANRTANGWGESLEMKTDAEGWWSADVLPGRINVRLGYPRGYRETGWFDGRVDNLGIAFDVPRTDEAVILPEEKFVREKSIKGIIVHDDGTPAIGWQLYGRPLTWNDVGTGGVPCGDKGEFTMRYPEGYQPRLFEAKNSRWQTDFYHTTDKIRAKVLSRDPLRLEIPSKQTNRNK